MSYEPTLTTREVAHIFRVTAKSVINWGNAEEIKYIKTTKGRIYSMTSIRKVIERGHPHATAKLIEEVMSGGLLLRREAADRCGVSPQTIMIWIKKERIICVRTPGGDTRIPASEVERVLEENAPPLPADDHELMTPREAAKAFQVDPATVRIWANSGKLKYLRTPGGERRYFRSDVPEDPLMTPKEVAQELQVCSNTVIAWAESGKLRWTRTSGGHRRYFESDVQRLSKGSW